MENNVKYLVVEEVPQSPFHGSQSHYEFRTEYFLYTYDGLSQTQTEVFFHGHKTKSIVFGHTHKKMVLKIFNNFFY